MARTTRTPEEDAEITLLQEREARLRARIEELEAERSSRPSTRSQSDRSSTRSQIDEATDRTRDNMTRAMDEASNLARGVTLASLEVLRTATDAVSTFVNEVYDRNQPDDDRSINELARQLPGDIVSGFMEGVYRVFDGPSRAVDTLSDTYRRGRSSGQERASGRRRSTSRADEASERSQSERDRIKEVLGRPVTRVILDAQDRVILNVGEIITNQAVGQARLAGVLDILLDSAYRGDPQFTTDQMRGPRPGTAALEEKSKSSS